MNDGLDQGMSQTSREEGASESVDRPRGSMIAYLVLALMLGILPLSAAADKPSNADSKSSNAERVDDAIRKGVEYLIRIQRLDGSWNSYNHGTNIGTTALCALSLRKAGLEKDHPAIRKAINLLHYYHPTRTYDVSVLTALLEAVDPVEHKGWIEQLGEMLLDTQRNGLWAYPTGAVDMSNTQYAALGLQAATHCGFKVGNDTWRDLFEVTKEYLTEDGGWGYRLGSKATGSMTCAGLTCLFICHKQLTKDGTKKVAMPRYDRTLEAGLAWLDRHFLVDQNPRPHEEKPGASRWHYYYLYGIERIGALSKRVKFGDKDWYLTGVDFLVPRQHKDGSWGTAYGETEINTAFSLLFLSRATLGARTKGNLPSRVLTGEKKGKDIVLGCNRKNPGFIWIESWSPKVADKYGVKDGSRAIRVAQVEYFQDGKSLGVVTPRETDERVTRCPLEYHFEENGRRKLTAKVTCVSQHGTVRETFDSGGMDLYIHDNFTERDQDYMDDVGSNLLKGVKKYVTASSEWSDGWRAARAVDGLQGPSWLSAKPDKDPAPWIQIELEKPVRANLIKLTHVLDNLKPGWYGRANRIRILVNRGKQKFVVNLGTDEFIKYEIPIKRTRVRELRIEMLDRVKGKNHVAAGFGEIELFYVSKR